MLLENKVAVIYGAGGPIGGAAACAFAREGARVFLAGRTQSKLDYVAGEIHAKGGAVDTAVVDATDERAVEAFVDGVVQQAGAVDISFNLIGYGDVQKPLTEISVEDFPADHDRMDIFNDPGSSPAHGQARVGGDPGVRRRWPANSPRARRLQDRP
jgi:NAD(P)-dependent dehydrogenase (short-subunit alcohol dehydrogenase family)